MPMAVVTAYSLPAPVGQGPAKKKEGGPKTRRRDEGLACGSPRLRTIPMPLAAENACYQRKRLTEVR